MAHHKDDINTPLVAAIGVISTLVVVGVIVGVQALFYHYETAEVKRKVVAIEEIDAKNLIAEQEAKLSRSGWLDRKQGTIAIPIRRAMDLVVSEMQSESEEINDDS